jgi:hypothetical protein
MKAIRSGVPAFSGASPTKVSVTNRLEETRGDELRVQHILGGAVVVLEDGAERPLTIRVAGGH